jgi:thiol:disulfide interchange protein DsbC
MGILSFRCYIEHILQQTGGVMKKKSIVSLIYVLLFVVSLVLVGGVNASETTKQPVNKAEQQPVQKQEAGSEKIEDVFKKAFPRVPFDTIKPADIKGVYEVTRGSELIYFIADPGYLFVGDIISKEGKSLTEARKGELAAEKAKDLPLDKAIKVGSGKNTILEFTDPDCPYCRKASEFLEQKKDVTRYIYFIPLPMHPDAENKVKYIFCAEDKGKAYEDAMKGKLDDQKYEKCTKPEAIALLNQHKEIGARMGISGTPFFIINGKKSVVGANTPEIEAALIK